MSWQATVIATHVCPTPTILTTQCRRHGCARRYGHDEQAQVDPAMDAVLSVDTKGNRVVNRRGFALSPTVKEGYILRVSEDLLSIAAHRDGPHRSPFQSPGHHAVRNGLAPPPPASFSLLPLQMRLLVWPTRRRVSF